MGRKPFYWRKLTPAQIELIERLAAAGGLLPYGKLAYRELVALDELQKLNFVDMRAKGRSKLEVGLTDAGRELRANGYRTERVILRVTGPQIEFMRHLLDGPIAEEVGQPMKELHSTMLDICRRMMLRGWVEWYDGLGKERWARLTKNGREVLDAVTALDDAIAQMAKARRHGRLH